MSISKSQLSKQRSRNVKPTQGHLGQIWLKAIWRSSHLSQPHSKSPDWRQLRMHSFCLVLRSSATVPPFPDLHWYSQSHATDFLLHNQASPDVFIFLRQNKYAKGLEIARVPNIPSSPRLLWNWAWLPRLSQDNVMEPLRIQMMCDFPWSCRMMTLKLCLRRCELHKKATTTKCMICPEKKWRELSSCLITSGYVNAAKLPWAVGTFWNLFILGCVETFITESLLLSLVSSHKGGAGLVERYTHGMVLPVLLKTCVSMFRARRVNIIVNFMYAPHSQARGGYREEMPCFRCVQNTWYLFWICQVGTAHASHNWVLKNKTAHLDHI